MEPDGTIPGTSGSFAAWTMSQAGTNDQAAELLSDWQPAGQSIAEQTFSAFDAAWQGLIKSWQDALAPSSPGDAVAADAFAAPLSTGVPGFSMSPVALPAPADGRNGTGVEPTLPPAMATFWQQG